MTSGCVYSEEIGDSYNSPGMTEFMHQIESIHEGIFVHSIYLEENSSDDQKAGWVSAIFFGYLKI